MKYKGREIGEPILAQIEEYISVKGFCISPKETYDVYKARGWKTRKKQPIKTLEAMVDSYNGVVMSMELKKKEKIRDVNEEDVKEKIEEAKLGNQKLSIIQPYAEQLKDDRWKAFRCFVFAVRGRKCEICGCRRSLQVHHLWYFKNHNAWEYTVNQVMVLCRNCHAKMHGKPVDA